MLIDKLKKKEYYLNKLTMFLRNSYGMEEQFTILWKLLNDIDSSIDDIFNALSLIKDVEVDDMLDKIAEIVGTKRNLDVKYTQLGVEYKKTLNLNNSQLIMLIKTRIIQNNYIGTYKEFINNYKKLGLEVLIYDGIDSNSVTIVLNDNKDLSDDDSYLFLSGNYTIRSMGIIYNHSIQTLEMLGLYDSILSTWNSSHWGV